jgi:uncharacterized metal-binding protein
MGTQRGPPNAVNYSTVPETDTKSQRFACEGDKFAVQVQVQVQVQLSFHHAKTATSAVDCPSFRKAQSGRDIVGLKGAPKSEKTQKLKKIDVF